MDKLPRGGWSLAKSFTAAVCLPTQEALGCKIVLSSALSLDNLCPPTAEGTLERLLVLCGGGRSSYRHFAFVTGAYDIPTRSIPLHLLSLVCQ